MTKRPSSFSEAFRVLDEALLQNPKPSFGPLVNREVKVMREQVSARAQAGVEQAQVAMAAGTDQAKAALSASAEQAKIAFDSVSEHASDFAKAAGKEISENPVPYLAAAAAGALILGFLIASPKRQKLGRTSNTPSRTPRVATSSKAKTLKRPHAVSLSSQSSAPVSRVLAKDLKPHVGHEMKTSPARPLSSHKQVIT